MMNTIIYLKVKVCKFSIFFFSSIPMTFFSLIKLILRFLLPRIYISIVSDTRRTIKRWFFSSTKTFHWKLKFFFWRSRSESKWMMTKYKKIHTYIIYIITLLTIQRDEKKMKEELSLSLNSIKLHAGKAHFWEISCVKWQNFPLWIVMSQLLCESNYLSAHHAP